MKRRIAPGFSRACLSGAVFVLALGVCTSALAATTVTNVSALSANGTYGTGKLIPITVSFSAVVNVTGTPELFLNSGGTATFGAGSGTSTLVFNYAINPGENSAHLDYTSTVALFLNGGTINDAVPSPAVLTLPAPGAAGSLGANKNFVIDTVAPTVTSVSVPANGTYGTGQNLDFTVNWDKPITAVTGTPQIAITLDIGGTVHASYLSGAGTTSLVFRYTIQAGNQDLTGITIGSLSLNGGAIQDSAGNAANLTLNSVGSTAGVSVDAIAPVVTTTAVPANATYLLGQNLDFTVTFNKPVAVTGTPQLLITLDVGGVVAANYISGSGTNVIVFRHTVAAGESDPTGIALGGAISLNGGTIAGAASTTPANTTLNGVGSTAAVLVNAATPFVTATTVPANGTYGIAQNLDLTVTFNESVTVTGTPQLQITLDVGGVVTANYVSGSGTNALVFRHTVAGGESDPTGIALGGTIALNGGTIKDAFANPANTTLNGVGSTAAVLVDGIAPVVTATTVPANGTYGAGQNLDFTVTFSENVTVTGTPQLQITLDVGGVVQANYVSGSGTNSLLFRYTIASGKSDPTGIALGGAIALNGGTIVDAGTNPANTTLNGVGSTAGVLVDAIAPVVTVTTVPANGTYGAAQNLNFTVTFSKSVTVTGTPQLLITLDVGGVVPANYESGSGTNSLLFRHTVASGESDPTGIALGAAIALNGGTIADAFTNPANPTLNGVGSTTGVLVDGIAPVVTVTTVPANGTYGAAQNLNFTVTFSKSVIVTGTPQLQVTLDVGGVVPANYLSGSGTSAILFRYTVQPGQSDPTGIALAGAISLNGGTITDAATNPANTTLNGAGSTAAVLVDGIAPSVTSVLVPANGVYGAGQNLNFTVNFSKSVTVTGTPQLPITLDVGGVVQANYLSGSGTSVLLFRYTVQPGQSDPTGIALGGAIALNGGTISDAATNPANTTLNGVGSTAGVLVDGIAPSVTSVLVPANGVYGAGQNLDFTVNFSQAVTVNTAGGTPGVAITLDTGGTVSANYISGSGTGALLFRYTVLPGQSDPTGITLGGAIALNGGTVADAASNPANTTLSGVPSTSGILVGSFPPVITTSGGTTSFVEGGAPVVVDAALTVTDLASATLLSATASITAGFSTAEDSLAFTPVPATMGNINGSYSSATGVMTLTSAGATATVAQWQTALRAITYGDSSIAPSTVARTITFIANDGMNVSAAAAKAVVVTAVNNPPVNAVPVSPITSPLPYNVFSTGTGNAISIGDPDAGANPVQVTLTGTNGTITLGSTAGLTFTAGSGTADPTMTFTGTIANINAALNGLRFSTVAGGSASLQITTNDLGNTGTGGALTATSTINMTLIAVAAIPTMSDFMLIAMALAFAAVALIRLRG